MNIGLVLSGGVAKGAYQAGFLKALEEEMGSNHITSISCASIGLFSGYAFAERKRIYYVIFGDGFILILLSILRMKSGSNTILKI